LNFTVVPFLYAFESLGTSKSHGKTKAKVARRIGVMKALSASLACAPPSTEAPSTPTPNPFSASLFEFMSISSGEGNAASGAGAGAEPYVMPVPPRDPMRASKTDAYRLCLQKLFLFCLRRFIPLKYVDTADLLQVYPEFMTRDAAELGLLRHAANWFDLILHTIKSQNNKSFLVAFVPQLSEGFNAKYITGSGESQ